MSSSHLIPHLDKLHLIYLGILPALTTFTLINQDVYPTIWLIFLGGIGAVSVYLVATYSYLPAPKNWLWTTFLILDGPFFVLLSLNFRKFNLDFAIEGFLVEGTAVWLAIAYLALTSDLPSPSQRFWSVVLMGIAIGATYTLIWPYMRDELWGEWRKLFWLGLGIVEATAVRFTRFRTNTPLRNEEGAMVYILIFLALWLAALFIGNILRELGVQVSLL